MTEFLTDTVTVKPVVVTQDAEGGEVRTPSSGTPMAAYVRDARGRRARDQGRQGAAATHIVYFAADPGLAQEDVVAWGSRTLVALGPADHVSDPVGAEEYWSLLAVERT